MSDASAGPGVGSLPSTRVGVADLGQRLVVRIRTGGIGPSGGPEMTDVVGTLEAIQPALSREGQSWEIRRKNGELAAVSQTDVVTVKRLAPTPTRLRRASDISIAELEAIAAQGWQPLESSKYGSWLLRQSRGFTGRGNSVLPLDDAPPSDVDKALDSVKRWYRERGLAATFAVPMPWQNELDALLNARGWTAKSLTHVLIADVAEVLLTLGDELAATSVTVVRQPTQAWLDTYSYRGDPIPDFAGEVMVNADHPVFASISDPAEPEGELLAVGRAALTDDWVGITAVDVRERARRRGLGTDVMRTLLHYAYVRGHRFAYLQVATENEAARAMYDRLGFVEHHQYQYRSEPPERGGTPR